MNRFLSSSLGQKVVMAVTGLFLITFLIVHCGINALIFYNDGGETFEAGAHFMGTNPIIRTMEVVLFLGLLIHMYQALILTRKNQQARPVKYAVSAGNATSKWYSRSMGILGSLILMFLIIHLKHFWVVSRFTDHLEKGETMYAEMQEVFENMGFVIIYVLGVAALCYHLVHGFGSAFQTLGMNNKIYTPIIRNVGIAFSIIICFVFAMMPIAMHFGLVK